MTHRKQTQQELSLPTSFTITQLALGLPLQFEPTVGSKELDDLVESYIPGPATAQQKRAQVALEFFNTIEASCCAHPVSLRYNVALACASARNSDSSWSESNPLLSSASTVPPLSSPNAWPRSSKPSGSLKRARIEPPTSSSSPTKRLPGFSILTMDGVDVTEHASRGPKTKEQRDHAALMRKLKACTACKRSKQRCDPSHHRPMASALQSPISVSPSSSSVTPSSSSSIRGSRGSISPQSSLGDSFSESPASIFKANSITHVGQEFSPLPTAKSISPLSSFTLPDPLYADSDLSAIAMQDIDPDLFQLLDVDLDFWDSQFTAPPNHSYTNPLSYQFEGHFGFQSEGQRSSQSEDQLGSQSESQGSYHSKDQLGYQSEGQRSYHSEDQLSYQSKGIDSGSYPRNPDPEQSKYIIYDHAEDEAISMSTVSIQEHSAGQEAIRPCPSQACLTLPSTYPGPTARSIARLQAQSTTHIPANCTLGLENSPVQDPNSTRPPEFMNSNQTLRSLPQRLFSSLKRSLGRHDGLEHLSGMLMNLTLR